MLLSFAYAYTWVEAKMSCLHRSIRSVFRTISFSIAALQVKVRILRCFGGLQRNRCYFVPFRSTLVIRNPSKFVLYYHTHSAVKSACPCALPPLFLIGTYANAGFNRGSGGVHYSLPGSHTPDDLKFACGSQDGCYIFR
jgi:hypothetical protein